MFVSNSFLVWFLQKLLKFLVVRCFSVCVSFGCLNRLLLVIGLLLCRQILCVLGQCFIILWCDVQFLVMCLYIGKFLCVMWMVGCSEVDNGSLLCLVDSLISVVGRFGMLVDYVLLIEWLWLRLFCLLRKVCGVVVVGVVLCVFSIMFLLVVVLCSRKKLLLFSLELIGLIIVSVDDIVIVVLKVLLFCVRILMLVWVVSVWLLVIVVLLGCLVWVGLLVQVIGFSSRLSSNKWWMISVFIWMGVLCRVWGDCVVVGVVWLVVGFLFL